MLRYFVRIVSDGAALYTKPIPVDYSGALVAATDLLTDLGTADRMIFDCFIIDGLFDDQADRLSDQNRVIADIDKVYGQINDGTYWTLTAVVLDPYSTTWVQFDPVAPAI